MNDNLSYSSDEEYSQGNSGFENDLVLAENEVFPKEIYNEANEHLNHLPISPFLEDSYASLEDQSLEWDDFGLHRNGYFLSSCDILNFHLDDLDAKLDFVEKEIPNMKISAAVETTFDLCWEEIDDLCWEEVKCVIPQEKCLKNIKILFKILFIYICFVQNYLIINYKKIIKVRGEGKSTSTIDSTTYGSLRSPKMPGCCAFGCTNRHDKGFKMYRFPSDPNRRKIWENKVSRVGWKSASSSKLCEAHFDPHQFESKVNYFNFHLIETTSNSRNKKRTFSSQYANREHKSSQKIPHNAMKVLMIVKIKSRKLLFILGSQTLQDL
uniref:uncharacterized protein n=1 Tax=Myxine glutinosa TaxID=7769 RepID=UPI00358E7F5C